MEIKGLKRGKKQFRARYGMRVNKRPTDIQNAILKRAKKTLMGANK